jgi:hypothetical protein
VGHKRAHAEFGGQGEGLLVVGDGFCSIQGLVMRSDLADEA